MKRNSTLHAILLVINMLLLLPAIVNSQQNKITIPRDSMVAAAREIISSVPYCALISVDEYGQPQSRTMNPFPLNNDFVIWFATSRDSRKVGEIKNEPRVSVYFSDHKMAKGYVNLLGKATIIDDKELLIKMKRAYWEHIPNWQDKFVLIKIEPVKMEVINYKRQINGDPETSGAPFIEF